jgi:Cys-rich repeat protein
MRVLPVLLMVSGSGCDVVVGAMRDAGQDSGGESDAGCQAPLSCNWCSGVERRDNRGCVVGYTCKNGADPCTTQPCSQGGCQQDEECRSDDLCWPLNCTPKTEECNGVDDDCDGTVDDGATCPAGQMCQNGACSTSAKSCTTDSDCAAGQVCQNGVCRPELCANDSSCSAWQVCVNGFCKAKSCNADSDCGTALCVNGVCSPPSCNVDSDCSSGRKCVGGSCYLGCSTDADCDSADICVNGVCM